MRNKTVQDKHTPLDRVFMLDLDGKLDHDTMKQVNFHLKFVLISPFLCAQFLREIKCVVSFFLKCQCIQVFFFFSEGGGGGETTNHSECI